MEWATTKRMGPVASATSSSARAQSIRLARAAAVSVCRLIEGDDAKARTPELLGEHGHEGGFARPAVGDEDAVFRFAAGFWIEDVDRDFAFGGRDVQPLRVAQVEARAPRQRLMIGAAALGKLRRAEADESEVARARRWKPVGPAASVIQSLG
jgi:hypothetical protein